MSTMQNFEKGVDYKCITKPASSEAAEKGEATRPCNEFTGEAPKGHTGKSAPQMNFSNGNGR